MSGQQIGMVVGGAVGFFAGGNVALGMSIGGAIGGALDPPHFKAPGIGDPRPQTSQAGMPIPKFFGKPKPQPCTVIDGDPIARKIFIETEQGKGGGPTVTSEGWIATRAFLVGEADEPLAGIGRIRRNGKLVYSTIAGDDLDADSAAFRSQLRIYLGGHTQLPDPSLEAIHGVGNTPYHRGKCYFVVVDDDETSMGGGWNHYEVEPIAGGTVTNNCTEYSTGAVYYFPLDDASGGGTAAEVIQGLDGVYSAGVAPGPALRAGSSGSMYMEHIEDYMLADYVDVFRISGFGTGWTVSAWCMPTELVAGGVLKNVATLWAATFSGQRNWGLCLQDAGDRMTPRAQFNTDGTTAQQLSGDSALAENSIAFLTATYTPNGVSEGTYRLYVNGALVDEAVNAPPNEAAHLLAVGGYDYPDSYGFIGYVSDIAVWDHPFTDAEVMAKYWSASDYYPLPDASGGYVKNDGTIVGLCKDRIQSDAATLKDIITDTVGRTPCPVSKLNIDNLLDEVPGYAIDSADITATEVIRDLLGIHFADIVEYDGKLNGIYRGGATVATIADSDILALDDEDDDTREQALEYNPLRVTLIYPDPANNYVDTPATSPRDTPDVVATGELVVQTSIPYDATTARRKAEILQKVVYARAEGGRKRALRAEHARLVASDAILIEGRREMIVKRDEDLGMVRIETKYDRASAYVSIATGTTAPPPTPQTSNIKGPSIAVPMNLPPLRSSDDKPGIYVPVCGLRPEWPGADIYLSVDGGVTEQRMLRVLHQSVIGELAADCTSSGEPIVVQVYAGSSIASVTPDQIAARQNAFAIITGGIAEVGQAQTATEDAVIDRRYELTDNVRGGLGTTATDHYAGDRFAMLDGEIPFLQIDRSHAGKTILVRAVTIGTVPASNVTVSLVFDPPTFVIDAGTTL